MTTTYTVVGTSDENTVCDNCGKPELVMTVVLRDDEGEFHFFGRSCAARATGRRAAGLAREVATADHKRVEAADRITRWSRYLNTDGSVDAGAFRVNNRGWYDRHPVSDAEITVTVLAQIAEDEEIVGQVRRGH